MRIVLLFILSIAISNCSSTHVKNRSISSASKGYGCFYGISVYIEDAMDYIGISNEFHFPLKRAKDIDLEFGKRGYIITFEKDNLKKNRRRPFIGYRVPKNRRVRSIFDGEVLRKGRYHDNDFYINIKHDEGYVVRYSGLSFKSMEKFSRRMRVWASPRKVDIVLSA